MEPPRRPEYRIVVSGHLVGPWAELFDGLNVVALNDGTTQLTGVVDQSRLHGLFRAFRDLGVEVLSLHRVQIRQEEKMNVIKDPAQRRIEISIAVLFWATAIASIVGELALAPILNSVDLAAQAYVQRNQLVAGAVLWSINNLGIVFIAVLAYPLIVRRNPVAALAYLVTRIVETAVMMVGIMGVLLLAFLGQSIAQGSANAGDVQSLAAIVKQVKVLGITQISLPLLGLGGLVFTIHLAYRSWVPRFVSWTGIVGYALIFFGGVASWFGVVDASPGGSATWMALPVAVFEIVLLPFWLVLRGFRIDTEQGVPS